MEFTWSSGGHGGKVFLRLFLSSCGGQKAFIVVFYGGGEVKGEQPGWEGTSASFNVGKT